MPNLVAPGEISYIAVVPPGMCIRKKSNFNHFRIVVITKVPIFTDNKCLTMENSYKYFKRDISWLSFNYRVLLEAEDETLPIYERIKFLSIYSSNLEEFYEIRVAEHRGVIMKKNFVEESADEAEETLAAITREVNRQQRDYYRIFYEQILPELNRQHIFLYQDEHPQPFHEDFVRDFFNEEVFPFLSPVMIQ